LAGFCPRGLGQPLDLADARRKVHQTAGLRVDRCRCCGIQSTGRDGPQSLDLQLHSKNRSDVWRRRDQSSEQGFLHRLPVRSSTTLLAQAEPSCTFWIPQEG